MNTVTTSYFASILLCYTDYLVSVFVKIMQYNLLWSMIYYKLTKNITKTEQPFWKMAVIQARYCLLQNTQYSCFIFLFSVSPFRYPLFFNCMFSRYYLFLWNKYISSLFSCCVSLLTCSCFHLPSGLQKVVSYLT